MNIQGTFDAAPDDAAPDEAAPDDAAPDDAAPNEAAPDDVPRGQDLRNEVLRSRTPMNPVAIEALLSDPAARSTPAPSTPAWSTAAWSISHVTRTGSTNADLATSGGSSGQVLIAEEQLAGRGRSGRDWFCPPGAGLMFSVLLRIEQIPADRRGWVGAVLGLAIVRALGRDGTQADLKWPNDVLIGGRKCAGILGEVAGDALVIGAGINVSLQPHELPREDATSLLLSGCGPDRLNREALLAAILDHFGELLGRWTRAAGDIDRSGLRSDYLASCSTIGSRVRLVLPGGAQHLTTAVDVASDGALVVEDSGSRRSYSAADVVHLRLGQ